MAETISELAKDIKLIKEILLKLHPEFSPKEETREENREKESSESSSKRSETEENREKESGESSSKRSETGENREEESGESSSKRSETEENREEEEENENVISLHYERLTELKQKGKHTQYIYQRFKHKLDQKNRIVSMVDSLNCRSVSRKVLKAVKNFVDDYKKEFYNGVNVVIFRASAKCKEYLSDGYTIKEDELVQILSLFDIVLRVYTDKYKTASYTCTYLVYYKNFYNIDTTEQHKITKRRYKNNK